MRFSRAFIPTMKESPADAEVPSHRLLLRAGYIRKKASGLYDILPLGTRVLRKIEAIIREEMDRAGAQEIVLPIMHPAELWKESGRWDVYGKEMIKFKDRHGREYSLGPTAEEMVTDLVRREVKSYRDLPLNLYQIGRKFRDEMRPRFGLMRAREFIMKDAYSFHASDEDAEREYWNMFDTYSRIFSRMELNFKAVEAETGEIGGKFSHEFMVIADTGESRLLYCESCGYSASGERAEQRKPAVPEGRELRFKQVERVHTPGVKRVEDVAGFLGVPPEKVLKLLIYMVGESPVAVAVRGDRDVEEAKLSRFFGSSVRLASDAEVERFVGQPTGFLSPVDIPVPLYADYSVIPMVNFVAGAGEVDYHLVNVNWGRDFPVKEFVDVSAVSGGDRCPRCGAVLVEKRGIEVGHIFKLGTKYSSAMGAFFVDENGLERPIVMGCYGIGVTRLMSAIVEQNHDENGIVWPVAVAPFHILVIPATKKGSVEETAETIYRNLSGRGFEVLIDDRPFSPGFKFKDADLIGVPVQVVVGKKLKEGKVDVKVRRTGERFEVDVAEVPSAVEKLMYNLHSPSS
jgi:prolyl-tRNA synthetase